MSMQILEGTMSKKIIITGTMGSGKSSILNVLKKAGHQVVPECARTILAEQRSFDGYGVPNKDANLFCELLLSRTLNEYKRYNNKAISLYDRGLPDIIAYASFFNLDLTHYKACAEKYRYDKTVFLLEPWQDIYVNDEERKMTFTEATTFHNVLIEIYKSLKYELIVIPKASVQERVAFIFEKLESHSF